MPPWLLPGGLPALPPHDPTIVWTRLNEFTVVFWCLLHGAWRICG